MEVHFFEVHFLQDEKREKSGSQPPHSITDQEVKEEVRWTREESNVLAWL